MSREILRGVFRGGVLIFRIVAVEKVADDSGIQILESLVCEVRFEL